MRTGWMAWTMVVELVHDQFHKFFYIKATEGRAEMSRVCFWNRQAGFAPNFAKSIHWSLILILWLLQTVQSWKITSHSVRCRYRKCLWTCCSFSFVPLGYTAELFNDKNALLFFSLLTWNPMRILSKLYRFSSQWSTNIILRFLKI